LALAVYSIPLVIAAYFCSEEEALSAMAAPTVAS